MNQSRSLDAHHRRDYYIEEKGWFYSSYKSVSKTTFKEHQFEKMRPQSPLSHLNGIIQTIAFCMLAVTGSFRYSDKGPFGRMQIAYSAFALHFWSQLPSTLAQTTTTLTFPTTNVPTGPLGDEFQANSFTLNDQI